MDEARDVLVESVHGYPLNWSAWLDLATLCTSRDVLDALVLPNHWTQEFFKAHVLLEMQVTWHKPVRH